VLRLGGRELETDLSRLATETSGLGPVLALDVIDHSALRPRQKRRNHDADALAATRGSKGEDVFRAVMSQIVKVVCGLFVPASNVDTASCLREVCFRDVRFRSPPSRSVEVFGILRERLGASEIQHKKEGTGSERTNHNDSSADQQRKLDSKIARAALSPHPHKPFIGGVKVE